MLIEAVLNDYSVEYIRNGKIFISSAFNKIITIYSLNDIRERNCLNKNLNLKNINSPKRYLLEDNILESKIFLLNKNRIGICSEYGSNEIPIYELKYI